MLFFNCLPVEHTKAQEKSFCRKIASHNDPTDPLILRNLNDYWQNVVMKCGVGRSICSLRPYAFEQSTLP